MTWYEPFAATFEEWDAWEVEMRTQHPVQFFVRKTVPRFCRYWYARLIHDPWYYSKCLLFKRYNVVKVRTLPPTWCDADTLMLHACFQILVDFVEKEQPWEAKASLDDFIEAYGADQGLDRYLDWTEIQNLYHWWKERDHYKDDGEKVDRKLTTLMKYRRYLWT